MLLLFLCFFGQKNFINVLKFSLHPRIFITCFFFIKIFFSNFSKSLFCLINFFYNYPKILNLKFNTEFFFTQKFVTKKFYSKLIKIPITSTIIIQPQKVLFNFVENLFEISSLDK